MKTNDGDPARITRNPPQPRGDILPGDLLTDELTVWLAEGGNPVTGSAVYLRCLAKEVRAQRAYRATITHHHVRVTVLSAGHDAIDHGACDGVESERVAQPVLLGEMARRVADALCGPACGEASNRVQATTPTPPTDPGSRVPDCQTCLGKGYVRYLRHDDTRPIDPCPDCAMTGLGDAREVAKMRARLGQEVASSPDWMDRRGDWPPTPNRDRDRVTVPIMIPVRWGVSSDGRRVAVTGSGDPNKSVTPAPTPSPPVAPAPPSSPDLARRNAELLEALNIADEAFCPEHGHNSGIGTLDRIAELRKSALSGMLDIVEAADEAAIKESGSNSSLERAASALGDLDFIGLSNMLCSEMAGLDGAAWQAAEDLRQDCYYARMHDHQDARRMVAIALRARAAIRESTVMDAATRWARAHRAWIMACQAMTKTDDVAHDEIDRRQSPDYARSADDGSTGHRLLRRREHALKVSQAAQEDARVALDALRDAALALVGG